MSERRRIEHLRAVAGLVLVVVAAAACSGDTPSDQIPDDGGTEPAVGAPFATEAIAVCDAALAQKQAQGEFPYPDFNPTDPDPSTLPLIAPFLLETAVTFQTWEREMQALGQPPSGKEPWADLVDAVPDHARIATEQAAAAEKGDIETFIDDYHQGRDTQPVLLSAANAAGVPECAAVDR